MPSPDQLGLDYERRLDPSAKRRDGIHYTPAAIADGIVAMAMETMPAQVRVCDPAVGGGAFLLAAARVLERRGLDRRTIVEQHLWGVDTDPAAVAVATAALSLWSGGATPGDHLVTGDTLDDQPVGGGFDVVVGNPPFQGQLHRATARPRADAGRLNGAFGRAAGGYADTASLFLLAATRLARPGGRVAMIQPQSLLAARDAAPARAAALDVAALVALWIAGEHVFDAATLVCAPVLELGGRQRSRIEVRRGRSFTIAAPGTLDGSGSWSAVASAAAGVPRPARVAPVGGTLEDSCTATAGFRDQFYGLAPHIREHEEGGRLPRVVTAGLVDPSACHWGRRPSRIGGRTWRAPVVDPDALDDALARWVRALLVPKVVVATQTRVLEAAVDRDGSWVPSVPVIAVVAPVERLSHVAAVLLAPTTTAWAITRYGGTALTHDTIKLAARQVLQIPTPRDAVAWAAGAELVTVAEAAAERGDESSWRAGLVELGAAMCRAYGDPADSEVLRWWSARLPAWRRGEGR